MDTVYTTSVQVAAQYILRGEVVAFPTETVYGLGAYIFNEEAIKKIFAAKNRPADNPLIAHLADLSQLPAIVKSVPRAAEKLIAEFFPGALTLVLTKTERVPKSATAGLETIGVRMPRHEIAHQFLQACSVPIVAPSANLSGRPSPTTWRAVKDDLSGRISCILKGEQTQFGLESTVIDCTTETPVILRAGAITLEQLRAVIPATRLSMSESQRSPGTRYRHYSPNARIHLVDDLSTIALASGHSSSCRRSAYIGLDAPAQIKDFALHRICRSVEEYAHALFDFFRQCDEKHIETIYCQKVEEKDLGLALMDRLRRAAHN
jgi:L-threonylcarbamoyladenylate synthase